MSRIARQIRREFDTKYPPKAIGPVSVVVLDEIVIGALEALRAWMTNVRVLHQAFDRVLELIAEPIVREESDELQPFGAVPIAAASASTRSLIDLLSLFREDTSLSGRSFTIKDEALILEIGRELKSRFGVRFLYPKLLPVSAGGGVSTIHVDVQSLGTKRDRAGAALRPLIQEVMTLEMQLNPPAPNRPPAEPELSVIIRKLAIARARLESCKVIHDRAATQLDKVLLELSTEDKSGRTLLQKIDTGALIEERTKNSTPLFLHVRLAAAGGTVKIRRSLWRLFSDGLSFSGGAVASYAFLNQMAEVFWLELSGVTPAFRSCSRLKDFRLSHATTIGAGPAPPASSKNKSGDPVRAAVIAPPRSVV